MEILIVGTVSEILKEAWVGKGIQHNGYYLTQELTTILCNDSRPDNYKFTVGVDGTWLLVF